MTLDEMSVTQLQSVERRLPDLVAAYRCQTSQQWSQIIEVWRPRGPPSTQSLASLLCSVLAAIPE